MRCTDLAEKKNDILNPSPRHYHPPHPPLSTTFGLGDRPQLSPAEGPGANYQRDESCPSLERTHLIFSRLSPSCQEVKRMMRRRAGCKRKNRTDGKKGAATRAASASPFVFTVPVQNFKNAE